MPRNYTFGIGEYYHIYNRGNDRKTIFLDEHDHRRFLLLLYLCNGDKAIDMNLYFEKSFKFFELFKMEMGNPIVEIGAYCLMPNHFHILIKESTEGGISKFMKKLATSYSMYFNKKYKRTGSLYEGSYKSKHAESDEYLKYLFSYIHLNPVKIFNPSWKEGMSTDKPRAQEFLKNYNYSSYQDYSGTKRPEAVILNKDAFPEYFESIKSFEDNLNEWLCYTETKV